MGLFPYFLIYLMACATLLLPRVAPGVIPVVSRMTSDPFQIIMNKRTAERASSRRRELLFQLSFFLLRKENLEIIRNLTESRKEEKQYQIAFGIVAIMQRALANVVSYAPAIDRANIKFESGKMKKILKNTPVKLVMTDVLMNVALMADVILMFPNETRPILNSKNWRETLYWGLKFANDTQFLLDSATRYMFKLLFLELNVTENDLKLAQPYRGPTSNLTDTKKRKMRSSMLHIDL